MWFICDINNGQWSHATRCKNHPQINNEKVNQHVLFSLSLTSSTDCLFMGFFVPPQHQPNTVSSSSHFVVTSIWLNVFSDSSWSLHTKGWQFNEQIYNRFSFVSITVRSFARINKTINVVLKFSTHCVHTVVIDRQTEEEKTRWTHKKSSWIPYKCEQKQQNNTKKNWTEAK